MQILIYNWKDIKNPLVGGAEIITFEYAKRLVKEGHKVTWFSRTFEGCETEQEIDGVTIVRRGNRLTTYWEGYRYYRSLAEKPSLVIDMLNTLAWQTPFYARRESTVVQYINQLAKEVWDYELSPPLSWLGKIFEPLELLPYYNLPVVTYAPSTAADLVDWGYDERNIHLFSLGLDHSRYKPGKKADYPLFLQVCRMVRMKRPDLTLYAFAEVLKNHPEAKLALVGNGPYKEEVNQLVKDLGIGKSVLMPEKDILFFKQVEGDQKVALMQQAWCFVHPSVKEGWGMVLTEAAACGTPSIATAVTGQVDAVKDGNTGILVSKNPTVDELARAMERIITDHDLRHDMEKNCIKWAAEFDWDKSYGLFKHALTKASGLIFEKKFPISNDQLPNIYIITPVFNAEKVLNEYFAGIRQTAYPKNKIQIIMPDGGSTDKTRAIAKKYGAIVIENPLKTAESGKAVGVKEALKKIRNPKSEIRNNLICLLDSDNIIIDKDWFERMVQPFLDDKDIIGTEPWEYIRRDKDSFITRYTAMIGMSDPIMMFLGNYDRHNLLSGHWTELPIRTTDKGGYLTWDIDLKKLPTIGANGTIFRADFFKVLTIGDFLFDIEALHEYVKRKKAKFAKVKIGIVHLFSHSIRTFIRKQRRRVQDFHYFRRLGYRKYWDNNLNKKGLALFILSCVTVVPLLWQTLKGLSKKPDQAWFFHPLACWITLWVYGIGKIRNSFEKPALADRTNWTQG